MSRDKKIEKMVLVVGSILLCACLVLLVANLKLHFDVHFMDVVEIGYVVISAVVVVAAISLLFFTKESKVEPAPEITRVQVNEYTDYGYKTVFDTHWKKYDTEDLRKQAMSLSLFYGRPIALVSTPEGMHFEPHDISAAREYNTGVISDADELKLYAVSSTDGFETVTRHEVTITLADGGFVTPANLSVETKEALAALLESTNGAPILEIRRTKCVSPGEVRKQTLYAAI